MIQCIQILFVPLWNVESFEIYFRFETNCKKKNMTPQDNKIFHLSNLCDAHFFYCPRLKRKKIETALTIHIV